MHTMSSILGGLLFVADDYFPETPYIHAAWHLAAALGVHTCNSLLNWCSTFPFDVVDLLHDAHRIDADLIAKPIVTQRFDLEEIKHNFLRFRGNPG